MFLILGTPECKYCLNAKEELDKAKESYFYLDLKTLYGEGWRSVFTDLKDSIGGQRTIPILFKSRDNIDCTRAPKDLTAVNMEPWEYLGTFLDLVDLLEEKARLNISLDDDY
jgi:glutaredoxin